MKSPLKEDLKPGVLLLDLAFPGLGGAEGVHALRSLSKATKIVLLAERPDSKDWITALKSGVRGYCHAGSDPGLTRKVVESVSKGEVWVNRKIVPDLIEVLARLTERRVGETRRSRAGHSATVHRDRLG